MSFVFSTPARKWRVTSTIVPARMSLKALTFAACSPLTLVRSVQDGGNLIQAGSRRIKCVESTPKSLIHNVPIPPASTPSPPGLVATGSERQHGLADYVPTCWWVPFTFSNRLSHLRLGTIDSLRPYRAGVVVRYNTSPVTTSSLRDSFRRKGWSRALRHHW